jgi:hypothetical protein
MTVAMDALTRHIEAGVYDAQLGELEKLVQARLMTVRRSKTNKDFGVGDRVVFNTYCGTKYLQGHSGVVVGMKQKKLVVKLDRPTGRFVRYTSDGKPESSEISVPPSIVDLIK